ncbi:hypothetical protein FBZ87_10374 [Nitrospirillum amazonense]|uniref:Uncharacterized protein n=1 Tax=Nitrospirillum amazonense TaxID=28077 RepID=A0A560K2P8_9PROT|nr:hypothetical protein [Nitrospirillum amazonense]TWB77259.1 hypothetical protein FBZ87_10374 [Nitrospirillum amazonense]
MDTSILTTARDTLTDSLATLRTTLDARGQVLTARQWEALEATLGCMAGMISGVTPARYHLAALDPGLGKTTALVSFLQALCRQDRTGAVGVLVGLSRKAEIKDVVEAARLHTDDFAVFTADEELNALGGRHPTKARVLFTTQAMIASRCQQHLFADTEVFHYQGHPRRVRIWDETFERARGVTIERDHIPKLYSHFRVRNPDLVSVLETIHRDLEAAEDGNVYQVPDLASAFGLDLGSDYRRAQVDLSTVEDEAARRLILLSNKPCLVRHHQEGRYLISVDEHLPRDLAPLVILDASGRVRDTYALWEHHGNTLVRLPDAPKSYEGLIIHHWARGGGKTAFRSAPATLTDGIADTINSKPDEPWLVIHHKRTKREDPDIEALLKDKITGDTTRVSFLTWGMHHGTNAYANVPNVILAGNLYYREMDYEAIWYAATGKPVEAGGCPPDERRRVEAGEFRHQVLQALCRAVVRKSVGGSCPPCHAYVIASARTTASDLRETFPGCTVVDWVPRIEEPTGRVAEALKIIARWFADNPSQTRVKFKVIYEPLGLTTQKFLTNVRQHRVFMAKLEAMGIREYGKSKMVGFERVSSDTTPGQEAE